LAMRDGKIVLEASSVVENSGSISANAGVDGSPAGSITIDAPEIVNDGAISAAAQSFEAVPAAAGGRVTLEGGDVVQTAAGSIDVSGTQGGVVEIVAENSVELAGTVSAAALETDANGEGPATIEAVGGSV